MQTHKLGNSDLNITPVGYGAWAIGGSGWEFGWGSQDDNDSIDAIPPCARTRRQLDRCGRRLRSGTLGGSGRPRSQELVWSATLCLHQVRPQLGRARQCRNNAER
jgi:hypothetical protein